jgi:enoyl-CoA hydratase/carnithine racemase
VSQVEVETRGDVAIITLARPEKLNAITAEMLDGLLAAVEDVAATESVGAAVLTGRGRAFSAGGDITAMAGMDEAEFRDTIARYMRVAATFRDCPKPIIAAVHGYALAGGFELALLCDVRFAAQGTKFGLPDTPLGLSPTSGMTWLLPRVVGLGRAIFLTLDAEPFDADEAERIGLVSRVVEPDALLAEAEAFAHKLAGYPRIGVEWTKRGFHRALESTFAHATESELEAEVACFRQPNTRKRLRAFGERKVGRMGNRDEA